MQALRALRGTVNFDRAYQEDHYAPFAFARYAVEYANAVEMIHRKATLLMLHEFDEFLSEHDLDCTLGVAEEWSLAGSRCVPFCFVTAPRNSVWFVSYTVYAGSPFYLESRLQGYPSGLSFEQQTPLLAQMVLSSLYGRFPKNINASLEQLMRHANANPNVQIIFEAVQKARQDQGERFDAFLREVDSQSEQPWYTPWTFVLLFLDQMEHLPERPVPRFNRRNWLYLDECIQSAYIDAATEARRDTAWTWSKCE
jgi:hypothetical protein